MVQYIAYKYNLKTMIFILLLITMVSSLVVLLPYQISKYFADPQAFTKFGRFCWYFVYKSNCVFLYKDLYFLLSISLPVRIIKL